MAILARRRARVALSVLVAVAGAVLCPGVAWAGDGLVAADPVDGTALATAPAAVVLTFTAAPDPDQSHVSVRSADGTEVGSGDARVRDRTGLRQPVSIPAPGDYTVAYHVVFDDGTDLVGAVRFSVGTGRPPPALSAAQLRRAGQAVAAGHDHGVDPLSGTLLVADLVVLVGVVLALLRRPRPRGVDIDDVAPGG